MLKSFLLGILAGLPILAIGSYFLILPNLTPEPAPQLPTPKPAPLKHFPSKTPTVESSVLDCQTDFQCFINASKNCAPSKLKNTATVNLAGISNTTTSHFEIQGQNGDKCSFYLKTEQIDLVFPSGTPPKTINEQNEIYDALEGKDGTCQFNQPALTAMLERWAKGTFDSKDYQPAQCQGPYFFTNLAT